MDDDEVAELFIHQLGKTFSHQIPEWPPLDVQLRLVDFEIFDNGQPVNPLPSVHNISSQVCSNFLATYSNPGRLVSRLSTQSNES